MLLSVWILGLVLQAACIPGVQDFNLTTNTTLSIGDTEPGFELRRMQSPGLDLDPIAFCFSAVDDLALMACRRFDGPSPGWSEEGSYWTVCNYGQLKWRHAIWALQYITDQMVRRIRYTQRTYEIYTMIDGTSEAVGRISVATPGDALHALCASTLSEPIFTHTTPDGDSKFLGHDKSPFTGTPAQLTAGNDIIRFNWAPNAQAFTRYDAVVAIMGGLVRLARQDAEDHIDHFNLRETSRTGMQVTFNAPPGTFLIAHVIESVGLIGQMMIIKDEYKDAVASITDAASVSGVTYVQKIRQII